LYWIYCAHKKNYQNHAFFQPLEWHYPLIIQLLIADWKNWITYWSLMCVPHSLSEKNKMDCYFVGNLLRIHAWQTKKRSFFWIELWLMTKNELCMIIRNAKELGKNHIKVINGKAWIASKEDPLVRLVRLQEYFELLPKNQMNADKYPTQQLDNLRAAI